MVELMRYFVFIGLVLLLVLWLVSPLCLTLQKKVTSKGRGQGSAIQAHNSHSVVLVSPSSSKPSTTAQRLSSQRITLFPSYHIPVGTAFGILSSNGLRTKCVTCLSSYIWPDLLFKALSSAPDCVTS